VDQVSGDSTTEIHVGDTVRWVWVGFMEHSSTQGPCPPCNDGGDWNSGVKTSGFFNFTFNSEGTFPYFCIPHGSAMTGTVIVTPP
jgi:plastocyanin